MSLKLYHKCGDVVYSCTVKHQPEGWPYPIERFRFKDEYGNLITHCPKCGKKLFRASCRHYRGKLITCQATPENTPGAVANSEYHNISYCLLKRGV